jgi:choline dehydrogenase-like flavoprotein
MKSTQTINISADVCIVGSGCGGGVCVKILAEAGMKVVLVEEGGYFKENDFTQREDDAYQKMYQHRGGLATDDLSFTILQGKTVGGSSTVNWTTSLRTPRSVLDYWEKALHLEEYSYNELLPYFEKVERYLNIHPEPYERHNENNRIVCDGARALGYRSYSAGRNVDGCIECGFCGMGCSYGVKLSVNRTYIPDAEKAGAQIIPRARAEKISVNGNIKTVEGNLFDVNSDERTGSFAVNAPVVIVAASAINTPVLLLKSKLANQNGRVGSTLTLHPTTAVLGVFDRIIDPGYGIPQSAVCDEFMNYRNDGGGYWIEGVPVHPALAAISLPEFGERHRSVMEKYRYLGASIVLVRDTDSSGSVGVNEYGRPNIRYKLGDRDRRYLREGLETAARIQFAAGAREVGTLHVRKTTIGSPDEISLKLNTARYGPNEIVMYSAHPLSSCRMGLDPRRSVVKPDGETHEVPGLYICDGSILPTSLGINPQLTILAIAEKIAAGIAGKLQKA